MNIDAFICLVSGGYFMIGALVLEVTGRSQFLGGMLFKGFPFIFGLLTFVVGLRLCEFI